VLLLVIAITFIFQSQFYRLKMKSNIKESYKTELSLLGQSALITNDVPVASLLVYKDSIIGMGFNTVKRDSNLSGHAEINAMNEAYKAYGDKFSSLERNDLVLFSTFEPCEMCKGAILHYNIKQVEFEQNKNTWSQIKSSVSSFLYHLNTKRFKADSLQEKLFLLHPDYPKK
jgi:tRNA(Arg) A34 adenosine deaminase TadA